jgi:2,4-didehydro-3-deoxy-L-rhamnonate hydrolase
MKLLTLATNDGPRLGICTSGGIVLAAAVGGKHQAPSSLQEFVYRRMEFDAWASAAESYDGCETDTNRGSPRRLFEPRNIICVGLNYRDHAIECNRPIPQQPILFAKWTGSIIGAGEDIVLPPDTHEVDYEAELAVVIGRECHRVSERDALKYVAGYTCMNDVSARDFQRADGQWVRAKSQDTFGPMGPYLVTPEEIPEPQTLYVRCILNENVVQNSNTREMIFGVRELIAYISRGVTLRPGDVICTGTPSGIGQAQKPPRYLIAGDEIAVEIEHVGRLANRVAASAG